MSPEIQFIFWDEHADGAARQLRRTVQHPQVLVQLLLRQSDELTLAAGKLDLVGLGVGLEVVPAKDKICRQNPIFTPFKIVVLVSGLELAVRTDDAARVPFVHVVDLPVVLVEPVAAEAAQAADQGVVVFSLDKVVVSKK